MHHTTPTFTALFKVFLCFSVFFTIVQTGHSQQQNKIQVGVELDVLPYITGGYFGAIWARKGHFGGRALFAKVNMPDFIVPEGFTDNEINSYALIADYFLNENQTGMWLGGGLVLWDGTIKSDQKLETTSYQSYLLNGSIGYIINLSNRFYLSPWAGLSLRVAGTDDIRVDNQIYDPPFLNPELSLKIGVKL
ncbi:hypothetical protein [Flagellimonas zhangzhouensis]|uniref:Outer membrane protein beta-barrel domain-containing protein n=1 Tax=Flagellimonas zhangzhouensis TaxID=1073328 RepID=A0A1H2SSW6_9FLAO|nr:hypothetical protein [Allomuricauda zhangzhouensis]SDQ79005.1 hypothetical protein SAMN05216294_2611 [Allomuricauda zhangzhouensis]SDW34761.1 hypothetical protein SAMN04487892_1252 [Allomuricauda zhangzhouensis]